VIGTLQLNFTKSLGHQGGKLCTEESVRVDEKYRGQGIGREMMLWATELAKEQGCVSMQLTTHKNRSDAHRFYASLGFAKSHVGMKLKL
jgi:GNAT superfamily N-acetyltransferase